MEKYSWKYHTQMGLDSGFSRCCILWFQVRRYYINFLDRFFHKYAVKRWHKVQEEMLDQLPHAQVQHVMCPGCKFYHWFFNVRIAYYWCRRCKWMQFRDSRCRKCERSKYERNN